MRTRLLVSLPALSTLNPACFMTLGAARSKRESVTYWPYIRTAVAQTFIVLLARTKPVQPFRPLASLHNLRDAYPAAVEIAKARLEGGYEARLAIARLWMSEGIPFAFLKSPALYEAVRTWVASRLVIEPKEITLTGSARLGQSLTPARLGAPFSDKSDLDFATVSSSLFDRL